MTENECMCGADPLLCVCRLGSVVISETGNIVVVYDQVYRCEVVPVFDSPPGVSVLKQGEGTQP